MSDEGLPHLPRQVRIFARLRLNGVDLECPSCGTVYIIRAGVGRGGKGTQATTRIFDEQTGIFQCTRKECTQAYQLGVNFVSLGRGTVAEARAWRLIPHDTVPTVDQSARIRGAEGRRAAYWRSMVDSAVIGPGERRKGPRGAGKSINTGPGCTCPETRAGEASKRLRDPGCPRHGQQVEGGDDD
jgi:hypothetical protein